MVDRDDLRRQLLDAFEGANYPASNPMDLVPALPDGPATTFESGDVTFTAMDLAREGGGASEFPYDDVESLVDDVMAGLEDEGYL